MATACKIINLLLMALLMYGIIQTFYMLDRAEIELRPTLSLSVTEKRP
jgi:hypothetical protein